MRRSAGDAGAHTVFHSGLQAVASSRVTKMMRLPLAIGGVWVEARTPATRTCCPARRPDGWAESVAPISRSSRWWCSIRCTETSMPRVSSSAFRASRPVMAGRPDGSVPPMAPAASGSCPSVVQCADLGEPVGQRAAGAGALPEVRQGVVGLGGLDAGGFVAADAADPGQGKAYPHWSPAAFSTICVEHETAVLHPIALWPAWQELTKPETCGLTGPSAWHRDHHGPCMNVLRNARAVSPCTKGEAPDRPPAPQQGAQRLVTNRGRLTRGDDRSARGRRPDWRQLADGEGHASG